MIGYTKKTKNEDGTETWEWIPGTLGCDFCGSYDLSSPECVIAPVTLCLNCTERLKRRLVTEEEVEIYNQSADYLSYRMGNL